MRRPAILSALSALFVAAHAAVPADHAERMARGLDAFRKDVAPLLARHCVKCHGGEKTKGGLDLTTRDGLLKGGADGPAVVPFDARASRLPRLVAHAEEPHMPSKGNRLPASDVALLAAWIDDGAPYDRPLAGGKPGAGKDRGTVTADDRQWWAFRPLSRVQPPRPRGGRGTANPVDAFLDAALAAKHVKPAPRADARTLARRAHLDLTGLPPDPGTVAAFERDRSADAWPRLVDRLLDSPRFGERWARHWLDVARFAESSGFEHDYDRPAAYHYRDFVIRALNEDMPYDQFVRWQLAGDEYEPDNPQALMATGFLGAGVFPTQITAREVERVRYDALDDMLSTTGTALLGLTVGCARCHDHKFDPIPTQDYYRLLATFTTTVRSEVELDLDPAATRRAKEVHAREHAPLAEAVRAYEQADLPAKFDAWLASGARSPVAPAWQVLEASELRSRAGATFQRLDDGSYLAGGPNGDTDAYTFVAPLPDGPLGALRLEAMAHPSMVGGGPGRAGNGNIGLSRIRAHLVSPGGATNALKLVRPRATFEQDHGHLAVASALDDDPHTGWAVDPRFGTNHAAVFDVEGSPVAAAGSRIRVEMEFALNTRHNIGRPRLSVNADPHPALDGEAVPAAVAGLLAKARAGGGLGPAERTALLGWWKTTEPGWRALDAKVQEHAAKAPRPRNTKVLVCAEGFPPVRMHTQGADFFPETHFLQRGNTELKRGVATPGFLQVLASDGASADRWRWSPPDGARFSGRRRTLAQWITDPDGGAGHLLARVVVNRLWQHHFGQGLVATPNDFGVQGAKPTHPELLDWLAAELVRGGWRLKPIHRLIMASEAYRRAADADAGALKADPSNALAGRWVPRRLEAEAVRDTLLAVSGVLETNLYGPGTLDPSSRRRSVYFTVKRSQLVPAMQAFDAPEPLVSQGTRPTTTVAPQALMLMNSPQVRSWAEAFGRRFAPDATVPAADAVRRAYAIALSRAPGAAELGDAVAFIRDQAARHRASGAADPARQALTDFAQAVLALNELIYVE